MKKHQFKQMFATLACSMTLLCMGVQFGLNSTILIQETSFTTEHTSTSSDNMSQTNSTPPSPSDDVKIHPLDEAANRTSNTSDRLDYETSSSSLGGSEGELETSQRSGKLSSGQVGWLISVSILGGVLGTLLAVPLAPRLGTTKLILFASPGLLVGALLLGFGQRFAVALVARFILFTIAGLTEGPARAYVSEVVDRRLRGLYAAVVNAALYLGQLLCLAVSSQLRWRLAALVCTAVPAVLQFVAMLVLPDSPKWLVAHRGMETQAESALRFYHGSSCDVAQELAHIRQSLDQERGETLGVWRSLCQRHNLRLVALVLVIFLFFTWNGGTAVTLITAAVFGPARLPLDEYQKAMLAPLLPVVFSLPLSVAVDRLGRLPMIQLSGALSTVGSVTICVYYYLRDGPLARHGWMVPAGGLLIQLVYSAVLGPITFNYMCELLPNSIRAAASNIAICFFDINVFIYLSVVPLITSRIGFGGLFTIHAATGAALVVFARTSLPETKGLTLEQIQKTFFVPRKTQERLALDERGLQQPQQSGPQDDISRQEDLQHVTHAYSQDVSTEDERNGNGKPPF